MDTYENDIITEQAEVETVGQPACPKEESPKFSPFADSPYEAPYAPPVKKMKKSSGKAAKRILSVFLILCLVVGSCGATAYLLNHSWQEKMNLANHVTNNRLQVLQKQLESLLQNSNNGTTQEVPEGGYTAQQVYASCSNAVVAVYSQSSTGSGFIISSDGYVVSNYHVVEGATTLMVNTPDGKKYPAKLVGYEELNDIALLKIDATELPFVKLGNSDTTVVGEKVVAIGNPLGELTSTLTVGYISAKDRVVTTDGTALNMLQTDAAINSGNSGGPLFNMKGEVVGIITAKYSGSTTAGVSIEGIGFAIPISDVEDMLEDLREFGYIKSTYLGVTVRDVDAGVIQNYGFPAGAYVISVAENGSAYRCGIQEKDIITNIGGYPVTSLASLTRVLQKFEPGETTTITVFRSGLSENLSITLDEKPQNNEDKIPVEDSTQQDAMEDWWSQFFPPIFNFG